MKASVVVPIYNQYDALLKTLYAFSAQRCNKEDFEVIVVDDGSTDKTVFLTDQWLIQEYGINVRIIHGMNHGRSFARNSGVEMAKADYIIFSDCDRMPELDFVEKHLAWRGKSDIVIGKSPDYFGRNEYISAPLNWEMIEKYSRISNYQKRISQIYHGEHGTNSALAWMSFLVGNSSMDKEIWSKVGGFDNNIKKWGFEHFDFAYRAWRKKMIFAYAPDINNYHIPHPREKLFYEKAIEDNITMFRKKYPEVNGDVVREILLTNTDVEKYENMIFC